MQCKNVKLQSCRWPPVLWIQSIFVLCMGSSAFPIVDLTWHGQWRTSPVRCQAPCSGKFAWLGNHPSLTNRTGAFVEVALIKATTVCLVFLDLYSTGSCPRIIHSFGTASYLALKWRLCSATFFQSVTVWPFCANEPRSLQQRRVCKNHNFRTATS